LLPWGSQQGDFLAVLRGLGEKSAGVLALGGAGVEGIDGNKQTHRDARIKGR
jgi:hypothetical protein